MGVQCIGQINIFVYISGNGMANTFTWPMMNFLDSFSGVRTTD